MTTTYDYLLNHTFRYLEENKIYEDKILIKKNPNITKDPRLIKFWKNDIDEKFCIKFHFKDIKIVLNQTSPFAPIFSFQIPEHKEKIEYIVNLHQIKATRFKNFVDYMEKKREELFPDLYLVSKYMIEGGFFKIFRKLFKYEPARRVSNYFYELVCTFQNCIVKPNNLYDLLLIYKNVKNRSSRFNTGIHNIISEEEINSILKNERKI